MAFEAIVRKQIEQLKSPMLKCVDMVVEELSKVVHSCSERVCIIIVVRLHFADTAHHKNCLQCCDAVGCAAGRAFGL